MTTTERKGSPVPWGTVGIALAVFAAYLPALGNGFVWNDSDYVTRVDLRGLEGLLRIWAEPGATEQYYPVLHSAFWVEYRLWGDAAVGYHLLNVLLHAGNACLLFLILRRLAVPGAWIAGLLYGVHPVTAESVAWISEEKNTLSTCFFLSAGAVYLGRSTAFHWGRYLAATALFLLAILTKSVAATLPAALLVVEWWKHGTLAWRRDVLPLVPWLVAGAAIGLFTAHVERASIGAEGAAFALSFSQRLLIAGRAVWFYLGKDIWPSPLIFMYERWPLDSGSLAAWSYVAAAVLGLAGLFAWRKRRRGALALALLFVGLLFPVLGFFNIYAFVFSFVADHFQYLACMAVFTGLAVLAGSLAFRTRATLALVVGVGLGSLTWRQSGHYRDSQTLYRSILAENPDCWLAQFNLANLLRDAGKPAEAESHYREALRTNPEHLGAMKNLGLALMSQGRPAEAAKQFEAVLARRPRSASAHNDLGIAYWALREPVRALAQYRAALEIDPNDAEAWYNLGLSLDEGQRPAEAAFAFSQAVRSRPGFAAASRHLGAVRNELGIALLSRGRAKEAVAQFEEAARLLPDLAEVRANLQKARERVQEGGR